MNKYRTVQYIDDGVYRYQCLSCKEMFEIRSGFKRHCINCGVKFLGKLESREKGLPRWVYDRYGNDYPFDIKIYPTAKSTLPSWIILERIRWADYMEFLNKTPDGWSEWKEKIILKDYSAYDIKDTLSRMRELEEDDDDRDIKREFRAIILGDNYV